VTARDKHLAEVLCHCDQTEGLPQDGHPLGTPGCASVVKVSNRAPEPVCRRSHELANCPCHGSAHGTCPACGKRARVVRIEVRADLEAWLARRPGEDVCAWAKRRKEHKSSRGPLLGARPGMAPHRVKGKDCPGEGKVPTETTYHEGNALREYRRAGAT